MVVLAITALKIRPSALSSKRVLTALGAVQTSTSNKELRHYIPESVMTACSIWISFFDAPRAIAVTKDGHGLARKLNALCR